MASIRKRGNSWYVEVRYKKVRVNETFKSHAAAKAWARRKEEDIDLGLLLPNRGSRSETIDSLVDDLIHSFERFGLEVAGPKRTQLNQIKVYFAGISVHDLTYDEVLDFAAYRRKRVAASTLQTQMYYLKQAVDNSRLTLRENVVVQAIDELQKKKIIMGSKRRERRLAPGEYDALMEEAGDHWIRTAIDIAVESAMRQGEIHRLKWSDIDEEAGVIHLWRKDKKAEGGRSKSKIPLLKGVREALLRAQNSPSKVWGGQISPENADKLIKIKKAASISDKFAKMTKKLGIEDLRFHDLRHEAISRLFEKGMGVAEVRLVSGHRTLEQLSRYVNLRAEDLAGM